jgi:hypothetical protein
MKSKETSNNIPISSAVIKKECTAYGVYMILADIASGSPLSVKYPVIIPPIVIDLFARIRNLSKFFGNWTLDSIPTLKNMVLR